jgi:hypothetical protein
MWKARGAAEKTDVPAQVGFAGQAVVAPQTGSGRIHRNTLANPNPGHIVSDVHNLSSHLMAEHHRFTQCEVTDTPFVVVM